MSKINLQKKIKNQIFYFRSNSKKWIRKGINILVMILLALSEIRYILNDNEE